MPELPEVETTVRGLRAILIGERLAAVDLRRGDLRRAFPEGLVQRLVGARITGIERRAKYGLIATDRDDTLVFHLGMSGRMRLDPVAIGKHDHVVFTTDSARVVALNDARRFGSLDLVSTAALADYTPFIALGPEPLGNQLTPAYLRAAFAGRLAPAKALLLDQRVIAGLGNIYVCEALFLARIHPARAGGSVRRAKLDALIPAIRSVLTAAIEAGGSSLRDYAQVDGELGYFQKQFAVYGREALPCPRCSRAIKRMVQSGRSSFFCSWCQR